MKKNICYILLLLLFVDNEVFSQENSAPLKLPPLVEPSPKKVPDNKRIFNLIYENDIFNNRDDGYTNGVRMAWLSSEEKIYKSPKKEEIEEKLPIEPQSKRRISIAVGQSMFTPRYLLEPNLIPNDRPYAGWLYGSVGALYDNGKALNTFMVTAGVVGPLSMAEQTQKFIHKQTDSPNPQGWDNQLHNEPGIILTYEKKWRNVLEFYPHKFGFDFTPDIGANLGNIYTNAEVGGTVRIGYDLPADYGPPRVRPSLPGSDFFIPTEKLGGYLFASVHGRAVARNIFLDGNSFRSSASVNKKPLIGELQAGIAITYKDWRASFTEVLMTKEFYEQKEPQRFGAVSVSYRF